ncbi:MAG: D-alanine--D-alanine ligase [Pseudomonadota bacterium]
MPDRGSVSPDRPRVALLCGGRSAEREISLTGGDKVRAALDAGRYEVRVYDPATDLARLVADAPHIDCALIILHGRLGEDGSIQGLLDLLDIPYQCSGVLGSATAMNKACAKALYRQAGLPVAKDVVLERGGQGQVAAVMKAVGLPAVIKPAKEGSSIGLSIARGPDELERAVDLAFSYDDTLVVEEYLAGREITAGVLEYDDGLRAMPIVEIIPGAEYGFFNFEAKYQPGATREVCPAAIGEDLTRAAQDLAISAHRALSCEGYSRTDMIIDEKGGIFLLETNTIPGMTPTSLFPQAAARAGLSFSALLDHFIARAMKRKARRQGRQPDSPAPVNPGDNQTVHMATGRGCGPPSFKR